MVIMTKKKIVKDSFEQRVLDAKKSENHKAALTALVESLYEETERELKPLKPFLLIRVLPRSTVTAGGILMPEKQNKPTIEAVVLRVYNPFWENGTDAEGLPVRIYHEADVKVGDHILLPHHVGLPDRYLDERDYRIIREDDAVGTLEYNQKGTTRQALLEFLEKRGHQDPELVTNELLELFEVLPKEILSLTTSGK